MTAPLIEFAKFAEPGSWLLRRGRPPWLNDPRWYANALRATLVLGLMGTTTGWLTAVGSQLESLLRWTNPPVESVLELLLGICGPGVCFGFGVLVPLSRWMGRGWIMALLAVPVSMLACYCAVMTLFVVKPIFGSAPDWVPGGSEASGFYASFVGAGLISLWMGNPRNKAAWFAGFLASILATLGCGMIFLTEPEMNSAMLPQPITEIINLATIYSTFQSLAAIGLGARLWWRGQTEVRE